MFWHHYPQHVLIVQDQSHSSVLFSPEFLGGFAGAFSAFLFGLLSYRIIKRYERFTKHYDALVILERLLNEHIDLIGLNKKGALNTQSNLSTHNLTHSRLIEHHPTYGAGKSILI